MLTRRHAQAVLDLPKIIGANLWKAFKKTR